MHGALAQVNRQVEEVGVGRRLEYVSRHRFDLVLGIETATTRRYMVNESYALSFATCTQLSADRRALVDFDIALWQYRAVARDVLLVGDVRRGQ